MNYRTIKDVFCHSEKNGGSFSFERELTRVSVVSDDNGKLFMRVYEESCFAENNGRPVTLKKDYVYPVSNEDAITEENWEEYLIKKYDDRIEIKQNFYENP